MPRYLIERARSDGLQIPVDDTGAKACAAVVDKNTQHAVTWVHSYVTPDKAKTFCIYDAPSPEAIRRSAVANSLPVDIEDLVGQYPFEEVWGLQVDGEMCAALPAAAVALPLRSGDPRVEALCGFPHRASSPGLTVGRQSTTSPRRTSSGSCAHR